MPTFPTIDALPDLPNRNVDSGTVFSNKMAALLVAMVTMITQLNAFSAALVAAAESVIAGVASINGNTGTLTGITENAAVQTLTNKTITDVVLDGSITEETFTITDGAAVDLDPANGTIQEWTLTANRTPTALNLVNGQSLVIKIADGAAYSVTWSTIGVVWAGGVTPVLPLTGFAVIVLEKSGGVVRGYYARDVTS